MECKREERAGGGTCSGACNKGVHYQRSSQQGTNMGREECRRTGFGWRRVQEGQLRKRIGYDGQG